MSSTHPFRSLRLHRSLSHTRICQTCTPPVRFLHTSPPTLVKRPQVPFKFKPPQIDHLGRPVFGPRAPDTSKGGTGGNSGAWEVRTKLTRTTDKMRRAADAAEGRFDGGAGPGRAKTFGSSESSGRDGRDGMWRGGGGGGWRQSGHLDQPGGRSGFGQSGGRSGFGVNRDASRDSGAERGSREGGRFSFGMSRSTRSSDDGHDHDREPPARRFGNYEERNRYAMNSGQDNGRPRSRSSFGMSSSSSASFADGSRRYDRQGDGDGDRDRGSGGFGYGSLSGRSDDSRSDRSGKDGFGRHSPTRHIPNQGDRPARRQFGMSTDTSTRHFHAHATDTFPASPSPSPSSSLSPLPSSSASPSSPSPSSRPPSPLSATLRPSPSLPAPYAYDAPSTPSSLPPTSSWNPTKKLTYPAMNGLRHLHFSDPATFTKAVLAEKFGISYEAVGRILRSKFDAAGVKADQITRATTAGSGGVALGDGSQEGPRDWDGLTIKQQVQAYDPVPHIDRQLARRRAWAEAERRRSEPPAEHD